MGKNNILFMKKPFQYCAKKHPAAAAAGAKNVSTVMLGMCGLFYARIHLH